MLPNWIKSLKNRGWKINNYIEKQIGKSYAELCFNRYPEEGYFDFDQFWEKGYSWCYTGIVEHEGFLIEAQDYMKYQHAQSQLMRDCKKFDDLIAGKITIQEWIEDDPFYSITSQPQSSTPKLEAEG